MDTVALFLAILAVSLFVVTFHAWQLGNEKRDVALLGTLGGICGVGTVVASIV